LWGIKGTNEKYEQLMEYNPLGNNVESICNVHLQYHPMRETFKATQISYTIVSQPPLIATLNWWGDDKWVKNAL
jgi:hypothetical protein